MHNLVLLAEDLANCLQIIKWSKLPFHSPESRPPNQKGGKRFSFVMFLFRKSIIRLNSTQFISSFNLHWLNFLLYDSTSVYWDTDTTALDNWKLCWVPHQEVDHLWLHLSMEPKYAVLELFLAKMNCFPLQALFSHCNIMQLTILTFGMGQCSWSPTEKVVFSRWWRSCPSRTWSPWRCA